MTGGASCTQDYTTLSHGGGREAYKRPEILALYDMGWHAGPVATTEFTRICMHATAHLGELGGIVALEALLRHWNET